MPTLFGLKLVPVLLATVAFYFIGFVWYGLLFQEIWLSENGLTVADAEGQSPIWMVGGVLITLLQVIGIGLVLRWRNVASLVPAVQTGAILWALFALPFVHYAYLYLPTHSWMMLLVDGSHLLVGWIVSAVILTAMK